MLWLFLWLLYSCRLNLLREGYGKLQVEFWEEFFCGDAAAAVRALLRRIGFDVAAAAAAIDDIRSAHSLSRRNFCGSFWFRIASVLAVVVAVTSFVNGSVGGGGGGGGGGGAEGAVGLGVDSPAIELPLDVGVPVVLDLIICSSRQSPRNEGPSGKNQMGEKKRKKKKH